MSIKIRVSYRGRVNQELDAKIKHAMSGIGAEWYAQGMDHGDDERDIDFEIEEETEDK